ncbi:metallophosphoesterase [Streptomyces physcomitrii]|uniref:Metallophosphoesterase n=1 Tax=Streptomyces physcomitrii TaxID=2724184 RepID=A0ABX1GWP8_9ACTN|nr:metallophosphoesterase [Streptomyces physcomitrii]NKI40521.1 metallophosphoesterase [Streptomyces physcomitrii]
MVVVFVLIFLAVLAAFAALHWYVWRRLFRDTTRGPGPVRRAGTVLIVAGPLCMFAALATERAGAPFWLQRVLAWPGFLWLALSLYLLLALLVGELVRPLLMRGRWGDRGRESREGESLDQGSQDRGSQGQGAEGQGAEERRSSDHESTDPESQDPESSDPRSQDRGSQDRAGQDPGSHDPGSEDRQSPDPAPAPTPSPSAPTTSTPTRRLFVSRVVGGAAAAAAVATVGAGTYGVLSGPKVKRVTVPLAKLPRAAHGFRIAVVSDIHLGPILGRGFAEKVVETINSTQPDLIAVVGDLVDGSVKDLGPAAAPLRKLRARHGSFFVTGNHEYFSGAEQWVREVRELGLHPLENARVEIGAFDLAGVNDVQGESEGQGPDFTKALGDRDRSRAAVLLAHQPVVIHDAVRHGVDLQLSGHTHGGQLFPGNLVAGLANPTLAGLEEYGDTQLYVSRGAGAWGPPTRVGAPSDITVVELASRQA